MKQFLILLLFIIFSINVSCQSNIKLDGKYISNKRYSDIWTLTLYSDSTYIFDSKMGESIFPGSWSDNGNGLVLSYDYEDKTYKYFFNLIYQSSEVRLIGKTKPFKRMKLKK